MMPPGQLICVSAGISSCLSYCISPPPVFAPFLSLLSRLPSSPFVPLCFSVCIFRFAFLRFAICFCFSLHCFVLLCFASSFFLFSLSAINSRFFACLVFLVAECESLSLFYTPRKACEPAICGNLRIFWCVSFLDFLLSFHCFLAFASLPDLNFFLSSLLDV